MLRLVANGGYLLVLVPFMWRYHACPAMFTTGRRRLSYLRPAFGPSAHQCVLSLLGWPFEEGTHARDPLLIRVRVHEHRYPVDALRYTHTMMRYLFESLGGVRTLFTAYSAEPPIGRGHFRDGSDEPLADAARRRDTSTNVGLELVWVGQRWDGAVFDPESLDHNAEFNESVAAALPPAQ